MAEWGYTGNNWSIPSGSRGQDWDGTYWWVVELDTDSVVQYTENWVATGFSFSVASQDNTPTDIAWDGTYLWVLGSQTDTVYKYNTSGIYQSDSFGVAVQDSTPLGLCFRSNFFYMIGNIQKKLNQYNSSGVFQQSWSPSSVNVPTGVDQDTVTGDFYISNAGSDNVQRYEVSGTTITLINNYSVSTQDTTPTGLRRKDNNWYLTGNATSTTYEYSAETPTPTGIKIYGQTVTKFYGQTISKIYGA